ncbi:O-methyltransferase [Lentithecium fluviatile CBS 122367]|uniref:O-methyltransferase n=1 Tax=Lentithecium fluviatile CBS 122367 TaxID=1168545 RepID=A0A6G1J7W5_9PLEO|nr:O-methyltransferase [Lentithecium fluviatile CBS 122367]
MANPPSKEALALLDNISKLSGGLKNSQLGSREGLLDTCSRLIAELSHPSETMLKIFWSDPTHLAIIRLSVDIQLFQALSTIDEAGKTSAEIAAKCTSQTDPVLVARMLRHLAAMHTIRETGPDTFAPTTLSNTLAEPAYQDTILFLEDDFHIVHLKSPEYFKQHGYSSPNSGVDGPFQYAFDCKGKHMFEYFQSSAPHMGKRFASMMDMWSKGRPRWFDEVYYPVKERLISGAESDAEAFLVDVGGGSGHDIDDLCKKFGSEIPGKLVLQDRPEIIDLAQVDASIEKKAHDFLTEQPESPKYVADPTTGARAYYLHSIIQDWNDEVNTRILKSIVPAMKKGYSKILVNDFVVPNQGAVWPQTALDWELMASLGARHRTEAGHKELYEGAGLRITGVWRHPQSLDSLIELELA